MTDRFEFGANWARFLGEISEERISAAMRSLQTMLKVDRLDEVRFLDAGSGSGLFSLAAYRLGARVASFDYDAQSVRCTEELRRRFANNDPAWTITEGSVLDESFLRSLGEFDVVYSWGVLHHTGDLWRAMELVAQRVASGGQLWVAIYNDQRQISERWRGVKQLYHRLPSWLQPLLVLLVGGVLLLHRVVVTLIAALLELCLLRNPLRQFSSLGRRLQAPDARGMHRWYDLVDWVGGWPFEVARPEEVFRAMHEKGFLLEELKTCGGGMGCNEFLFRGPEEGIKHR